MLTDAAIAKMQAELRKLRQRFAELHEDSLAAPLAERRGSDLLLALREWEVARLLACGAPDSESIACLDDKDRPD